MPDMVGLGWSGTVPHEIATTGIRGVRRGTPRPNRKPTKRLFLDFSRDTCHVFTTGVARVLFLAMINSDSRYTVDSSTRFVPVGSAEKLRFSRQLEKDDNRGMQFPANVTPELAPFTEVAGIGHMPEAISHNDVDEFTSYTRDRRGQSSAFVWHPSSGKANAKRTAGRLCPVTVHSTPSRKRTAVIRRCKASTAEKYSCLIEVVAVYCCGSWGLGGSV